MEFTSDVISLEVDQHVATLWLDREEARNAMGNALWRDLLRATAALGADETIRVLVIAAKGPHFSVGLDLKEASQRWLHDEGESTPRSASINITYDYVRIMQDSITSICELPFPVIAAVHGYCIGAGVDFISACDIRLASGDAIFSVREAKVALVADLGSLQRLPKIISAGHMAELAFTGKDISAERAAQIGLVNSVHGAGAGDVLAAAHELAREIAANSPLAVRGTKSVLNANDGHTVHEGLVFAARWNTMHLHSSDLKEAMTAFVERRAPVFTGD
ncbi:MAG: enoyl-CoA hydratase-related protein [Acidimicrobiales bacterium]